MSEILPLDQAARRKRTSFSPKAVEEGSRKRDDERSVEILRNGRSAADKDGKILIVEMVVAEGNEPIPAKLLDVQLLMGTGGRERTEAEYRALLEAAGLRLTRIVPTMSPLSVIEGERA